MSERIKRIEMKVNGKTRVVHVGRGYRFNTAKDGVRVVKVVKCRALELWTVGWECDDGTIKHLLSAGIGYYRSDAEAQLALYEFSRLQWRPALESAEVMQ